MTKSESRRIRFARIVTGVLAAVVLLWGGGLYTISFIPWWVTVAIGAALAIATAVPGMKLWRVWLGVEKTWKLAVIHFVVAGGIGAFALIGGNYYGAPEESARDVGATVIGKHSEKRDRYRTLRHGRRIKTGEYYVYYVDLMTPDSLKTERLVSLKEYNKAKVGGRYHLSMRDGLFGYPIIR